MSTTQFIIAIIIVCISYLGLLFSSRQYRQLQPSTMHTITWFFVGILLYFSTSGSIGDKTNSDYDLSAPFIFGMVVSSIVGFTIAHIIIGEEKHNKFYFRINYINYLLQRYRWIIYVCFVCGILIIYFLFTLVGFDKLSDYRLAAVTTKRVGLFAIVQRISGHASLLGAFYLGLLGYKHANIGINLKELSVCVLMYGMTNIAIAGRAWITMSLLPYLIVFFIAKHDAGLTSISAFFDKNFRKLLSVLIFVSIFFSVWGVLRNNTSGEEERLVDKFLYYTDGSGVTNLVMHEFPDGSFPLEYGRNEFLSFLISSPMHVKFLNFISDDVGLSVTVPSTLPSLYFDFGYLGGIIMWGVFCLFLELLFYRLKRKNTILSLFLIIIITKMMFQAPIGPVFSSAIPSLEWLVLLYAFRKKLFHPELANM